MKKESSKKGIFLSVAVIAVVFMTGFLSFDDTALSCSYCGGYSDSLGNIITTSINNSLSNKLVNTNTNNNNSSANSYATGGNASSQSNNNSINYINIGSTNSTNSSTKTKQVVSRNDDLDVNCKVSDTSIDEGDRVTFTADVSGGDSPYDYDWSGGTEGEDENDDQITVRYDDYGSYYVRVTVRDDDGNTASDTCPTVHVDEHNNNNNDDLEVVCRVSDTSIEEGDRVTFTADVDGGNSPYDYDWSGDTEGEDDNDDQITVRYDDDGHYEVKVTVRDDDGDRYTDYCPVVKVSRDSNDNNNINIITTTTGGVPTGQLSSLSSVYLSQVPYTGPAEIMKGIGFVAGILVFSSLIAYLLFGNRKKTAVSKKVSDFKESNRNAVKI